MSVTDIVSNMELSVYPIIALVMFLVAFGIIAWRVIVCPKAVSHDQAMMPLDDGETSQHADGKGAAHD